MFITKEELDSRLNSAINLNNILNPDEKDDRDKSVQANKDIERVIEGVVINTGEIRHTGIKGKVKGDENVPPLFGAVIAAQAALGASPKELRKAWGVSASTISNYKQGIPNRSNPDSPANKSAQEVIAKVTGRIKDKICEKIELALDSMSPEKFAEESSIKTLSTITSNLARTAQALESKKDDAKIDNRIQTIIYAPQTSDIKEYATLEVAR